MTWLKVDDAFDVDRRVQGVSLDARGLLVSAATYSARNLLDGSIDGKWLRREARRKPQRERLVGELVEAELVEATEDGGFRILGLHDDADNLLGTYTRAEVEARRRAEANKKRQQRARNDGQSRTAEGGVPTGRPGDTPGSPRSGRPWDGSGRNGESFSNNGTVADQERAEAEAERVRGKFGGWGA